MVENDIICAISTPQGNGAIAVIRLSGNEAIGFCNKIFKSPTENKKLSDQLANTLHFGTLRDGDKIIDEVVVSIFKAPHSYTGEEIVEISCHGSEYIQQQILQLIIKNGARMAKPGEFTLRAFINGKMDLSQAEAVADLIASSSAASHKVAVQQMRGGFSSEIIKLRDRLLHFISLQRAIDGLNSGITGDFLAQDIRETLHYLGEITTDEVLGNIFKNFCIGK